MESSNAPTPAATGDQHQNGKPRKILQLPAKAPGFNVDKATTEAFLRAVFGLDDGETLPEGSYIGFVYFHGKDVRRVSCASVEDAAEMIISAGPSANMYFETSTGPENVEGGRLTSKEALSTAHVRLDVDIASPFRGAGKTYPPGEEEALSIIAPMFELLQPSLVVRSGYGLQVYFCFKEAVDLADTKERMSYQRAAASLYTYCRSLIKRAGFDIDNVNDLARIMRIPGSFNCKDPNNPIQITFEDFGRRYASPQDIIESLPDIEENCFCNADVHVDIGVHTGEEVKRAVFMKIKSILDMEEELGFADTSNSVTLAWNHNLRPGDNSQSALDWRFLFALKISGFAWSAEELAAALVIFREYSAQDIEKSDPKTAARIRKKAKRSDYVQRTVANIMAATATAVTETITLDSDDGESNEQKQLPVPKFGSCPSQIPQTRTMAKEYPLPKLRSLPLFMVKEENRYWVCRPGQKKSSYCRVSSLFGVVARLCYLDENNAYGLRIVVQGFDGQRHLIDIPRAELVHGNSKLLLQNLLAHGLITEPRQEETVIQAIRGAAPENEILCVRRRGWFSLPDEEGTLAFAAPCGAIITSEPGVAVELEHASRLGSGANSGSLAGVHMAMTSGLVPAQEKVPHIVLGLLAGLSGPVLGLADYSPCGVSYSGRTSLGKSTAQKLAAGCWGNPNPGRGLFQTFNATSGAAEALAEEATGTCLILDELGLVDGEDLGHLIYNVSTGTGRLRLRPDASKSDTRRWSCFMLFSGEIGIEQKIKQDRGKWAAGLTTRVIDIDVSATKPLTREEFAAVEAILQHHGHLGPEFVRRLIKANWHRCGDVLRKRITERADNIAGINAKPALKRAAIPIAIMEVTGELAQEFDLLPMELDVKSATRWAWASFLGSDEAVSLDPEQKVLDALQYFISNNWDSRILTVEGVGINWKDALGVHDGIENVYLFLPAFDIAIEGTGVKPRDAARILRKGNYLTKTHDKNRNYVIGIPGWNRKDKAYALDYLVFGRRSGSTCDMPRLKDE